LINAPAERYERVLKRSPKLFQEVPNKYIANYLRMSPETLSRLKNLEFSQDLRIIISGYLYKKNNENINLGIIG
jgi:hypothetical protein